MSHEINQLKRNVDELNRQTAGIPVRVAAGSGSTPVPQQLALIVGVTGVVTPSPGYAGPFDLTFALHDPPVVQVVLLNTNAGIPEGAYRVDGNDSSTLDQLKFYAYDLRKEGTPVIGDVVRVWADDGQPVETAEPGSIEVEGIISGGNHLIFCDVLNAGDYLRDLPTDAEDPETVLGKGSDGALFWTDAAGGVPGPPGPTGATGATGPAGADGDTVSNDYCIALIGTGPKVIQHDAITTAAGVRAAGIATSQQQFWIHMPSAAVAADAKWKTGNNYIDNPGATAPQLLVNQTGSAWNWITTNGYDGTSTMLLGKIGTAWQWKTLKDWLNTRLSITLSVADGSHLRVGLTVDGTEISFATVPISDCAG